MILKIGRLGGEADSTSPLAGDVLGPDATAPARTLRMEVDDKELGPPPPAVAAARVGPRTPPAQQRELVAQDEDLQIPGGVAAGDRASIWMKRRRQVGGSRQHQVAFVVGSSVTVPNRVSMRTCSSQPRPSFRTLQAGHRLVPRHRRAAHPAGGRRPHLARCARGPRTRGTCTGASSAAEMNRCSPSPASPTRPTPGSSIGSRNSRRSGNATTRSKLPLRRHQGPGLRAAVVMVAAVAPGLSPAVLMLSRGLGVASNHSDITPSRKTSEAWSALESNRVRGPSCLMVLGQRDAARLRRR